MVVRWIAVYLPFTNTCNRCIAGPRFFPLLTLSYPVGQRKTALSRHLCGLSDRR
jgi:hypothetical protein